MVYQLRDYQKQASNAAVNAFNSKRGKNGILVLPTGCHAKGSKIPLKDGSLKNIEDIKVGDILIGDDGSSRRVLQLHRGLDDMYKIKPIKGEPFIVNGGHILSLYKTREGNKYECDKPRIDEITVMEYLNTSKNYKHLHKLYKASGVDYTYLYKHEYEPYLLGLYLGDGCSNGGFSITSQRKEVEDYLYYFSLTEGYSFRISEKGTQNKAKTYFLTNGKGKSHPLLEWLKEMNLFNLTAGDKFIPKEYLFASKWDRLELLAGLLDTDAWYDYSRNTFEYCTKSKRLAEDISFLCHSLGIYCNIGKPKYVKDVPYYRMQIAGDLDMIPTKVEIRQGRKRLQKKNHLVTGFTVEYAGKGEYYGFTIDGNHLYCDSQFFVHHNSGKSLVIADIAFRIDSPLLVLQPSKEILEQNYAKYQSYGYTNAGIYSASAGKKEINRITFAMIGSVVNHMDFFSHFKMVLIDECHLVKPSDGMYKRFLDATDRMVIGLTATPYRLYSDGFGGSQLKFITRTRPRVFTDVLYYCQISELLYRGYLAKLNYYDISSIDMRNVRSNSTGADYSDKSLVQEYQRSGFYGNLVSTVYRLLRPKSGVPRKGILVFTKFVKEAEMLVRDIPCSAIVTGTTNKKEREDILRNFKLGLIKVVVNVGVLTTGFDYPELDTVVMARPTKSLALWYQIVGRVIRPHKSKECAWVVDLCHNLKRFGRVEDLMLCEPSRGRWCVMNNNRQLTNVYF